jgi:hypothetical protein
MKEVTWLAGKHQGEQNITVFSLDGFDGSCNMQLRSMAII